MATIRKRTRAYYRHQQERAKARAARLLLYIHRMPLDAITPERIGSMAAQHCTCACWMCRAGKHDSGLRHSDRRRL